MVAAGDELDRRYDAVQSELNYLESMEPRLGAFTARESVVRMADLVTESGAISGAIGAIQADANEFGRGCAGPVVMHGVGQRAIYTVTVCDSPAATTPHIGHEHPEEPTVVKREPRRRFFPRSEP